MNISENVPLKDYSTMRLGGNAHYLAEAKSHQDVIDLHAWANEKQLPVITIGDGSNIIWSDDDFMGLVIVCKLMGFESQPSDTPGSAQFTFGAGENWDTVVRRTVELGYSGLEQLSLIPGTVGGTPVQNVGAYGREIKDVLVSVHAYDTTRKAMVTLTTEECGLGYRTSRFKTTDKRRFSILEITVKLTKTSPTPPFYRSLQAYLDEHNLTEYTPSVIRNAVIEIRNSKLPDPLVIANNGSFFANPIVSSATADNLLHTYPDMPHWPNGDTTKLSAAWLVEQSGFTKGYHDSETGMGLWKDQALVVVNEKANSTSDLTHFTQKIVSAVASKFGIALEQEPEII